MTIQYKEEAGFETLAQDLYTFIDEYTDVFTSRTHSAVEKAKQYVSGLFQAEKSNIEKMSETVKESNHQNLNHFISQSPWEADTLMARVGHDVEQGLQTVAHQTGQPLCYLVDESGWRKQGTKSVGVARQYLGSLGKVDNGQVAVFGSLVCDTERSLINTRLFLPECWIDDAGRCDKAGIPLDARQGKTKPLLALEMVREDRQRGRHFEWVGGDGLYGHDSKFRYGLADDGERYLLDIHADDTVYLSPPQPYIPPRQGTRGRHPTRYQVDDQETEVRHLVKESKASEWKQFSYRVGTKGAHTREVLVKPVWTWNGEESTPRHELLIISRAVDGSDLKYSLSNLTLDGQPLSWCELLRRQMQRYWVERSFEDAKSEVGMDEYQVRTWRAWHHHIALTMLALLFLLQQRVRHRADMLLLSCSDIRWILAHTLPKKATTVHEILELIKERHRQRQYDIDRCLHKQHEENQVDLTHVNMTK
jgi:SRSO17 transposase